MSFSSNFARLLESLSGDNPISDWFHHRDRQARRTQMLIDLCQDAMRRARYDPRSSGGTRLTDIGLLSYRTPENPIITRTKPVVTDARWLRPFAEIEGNLLRGAHITMRIIDSRGNILFEDNQSGAFAFRTRFVSENWLPLETVHSSRRGRWSVVVYINAQLIGIHQFEWANIGGDEILDQLHTDGEITPELQDAVKNGKFRRMSLDELLADQED